MEDEGFKHAEFSVLEDGEGDGIRGIRYWKGLVPFLAGVIVGDPDGSLVPVEKGGYLRISKALVFLEVFADGL